MRTNDGGPAFPRHYGTSSCADREEQLWNGGMSLRDYFAAKAMQGLIHDILIDQHWEDVMKKEGLNAGQFQSFLAHIAYGTADAMLKAREKTS